MLPSLLMSLESKYGDLVLSYVTNCGAFGLNGAVTVLCVHIRDLCREDNKPQLVYYDITYFMIMENK